ncbi:putative acetyl-hydrolase LipR [Marinobacter sp. JH2]|nr:alpha/beta hydrolase [Marinobacter sp. JH2]QBM17965.1 putative acetyl-hydrolase LipR [Marinobacter sp. JH2]
MERVLSWGIRLVIKPALSARVPVSFQRFWGRVAAATLRGPKGATYRSTQLSDVPTLCVLPKTAEPGRAVLYLHGGAYVMGGFASHHKLAAAVGDAAGAQVWLPDYRLAPEHPYPAALDDAFAVYCALLEQGQPPASLSIAGDSAGAGLTLALAAKLRDNGIPLPASLTLISPWADTGLGGDTITSHSHRDPMLSEGWLRWAAEAYQGDEYAASPLNSDYSGFPPILIQVGSEEILLSDAQRVKEKAQAAGVDCDLTRFDGLWHVFQLHYGWIKAADSAITAIGEFTRTHTQQDAPERKTQGQTGAL